MAQSKSSKQWKKIVGIFNLCLAIFASGLLVGYQYVGFDWTIISVIGFLGSNVLLALGLLLIFERCKYVALFLLFIASLNGLTLIILNLIMISALNADCSLPESRPATESSAEPLMMTSDFPLGINVGYYPDFKMSTSDYDKLCNNIAIKITVLSLMIIYSVLSFFVNFISGVIVIITKCRDPEFQSVPTNMRKK